MTDFGCAVVGARRSNTKQVHEVAGILRGPLDKTRIYLWASLHVGKGVHQSRDAGVRAVAAC